MEIRSTRAMRIVEPDFAARHSMIFHSVPSLVMLSIAKSDIQQVIPLLHNSGRFLCPEEKDEKSWVGDARALEAEF